MEFQWILDVLRDLKSFAKENNLPALAEQLDDTSHVALAEIAFVTGLTGDLGGPDPKQGKKAPGTGPNEAP
ncbi:MAG: hypothetical protein WBA91_02845 [Paracoccaceae bacterium]